MLDIQEKLRVTPLPAGLGADVEGIDLEKGMDDETFRQIESAWYDHAVLRFRGQQLSDGGFVAFGRKFGALDLPYVSKIGKPRRPDYPEMAVMSNIVENGKSIGALGNAEAKWHTDMSYEEEPPTASILYGVEVTETGGNTWFANMYAAYEALPTALRERVEGLSCKHDHTYDSTGALRDGYSADADPRTSPGAVHPLVCTHPHSGRKCLFLGRRLNAYIVGLDLDESEALLDELWDIAVRPGHLLCQKWQVGDLIVWDNRCTLHYRESFDQNTRRLLNRLQVKGHKPRR